MSRCRKRLLARVILWANVVLFVGACIAWPVTQLTIARQEPPFILALSWFAIVTTAWNTVLTALVQEGVNDGEASTPAT